MTQGPCWTEQSRPPDYLTLSYWERWLDGITAEEPRRPWTARLRPHCLEWPARPPQQPHGDAEIQEVPQDAVEEGDLVGAGEVEDHARDPAAERHAEHRGHQHGADTQPGLFGREELADDDGIRRHDAALDQAEQGRQDVQHGESVEG